MRLEKLEISGFKSFAKQTVLEFPSRVTGIVGPNGSGKSNVVESLRWVLGEQSMKTLRGKKGEDLIWNGSAPSATSGSPEVPRMGKASVTLIFDNADSAIPLEFEKVSVSRKIFRDGTNEYYLNNSQVRLKDVVELMARIGLGETKHNIINQGEVDRILLASPRDRREMLEEALGLRVYQLKKTETERKLRATKQNLSQVEALLREITPHLKFLRDQHKKASQRSTLEEELRQLQRVYFAKEYQEIRGERHKLEGDLAPVREREAAVKQTMGRLMKDISAAEKQFNAVSTKNGDEKLMLEYETKRRNLEREVGRLEGRLEIEKEKQKQPKLRVVDMRYIQEEIANLSQSMRRVLNQEQRFEIARESLLELAGNLERLNQHIERGMVEVQKDEEETIIVREIEKTIHGLQEELQELTKKSEKLSALRMENQEQFRAAQHRLRELDIEMRAQQEEERDLMLKYSRLRFEEERIAMRERVFSDELALAGIPQDQIGELAVTGHEHMPSAEIKRRVERLRIRLEEIGGIDPAVIKEHEELENRHAFLTRELEDVKQAALSLKDLIKELEQHIKKDFKEGFAKIKGEFHNYFRIIFGGGKASLHPVAVRERGAADEDADETTEELAEDQDAPNPGIEISVDLPRKRIKGLAMLSGGERALTAIALLFAISAVNPPPFLVLDETDAALDEANSQRYAAILKELAKRTQLILVTHNRETMKSAGILYGVTMGENGVSKLLSLKLEEAEQYTNR